MRWWHWIVRRGQEDRELEEELRFHLAEEARLRTDRGQDPAGVRKDFGNFIRTKEATREMWGWNAWERAAQDARFAGRVLLKNRAFTALAVLVLTLGIGATAAIFTVVRAVLLRPLQFHDPGRLVMVWELQPTKRPNVVQTQNFLEWRERNRSFEHLACFFQIPQNLETNGEAVQLPGLRVTAGFFEVLGRAPLLGRTIHSADDVPGAPSVVVLSYGLWQRLFGGRTDSIGQRIKIGPGTAEVIGVMPPDFVFPPAPRANLFLPMQINPAEAVRDGRNYSVVGRLRPDVSPAQADADIKAIAAQTERERPDMNARWSAAVIPLKEQTVKDSRTTLLVLLGAVGFVLLIACANVSNLLLMRASGRRREMALRIALGAGRWRPLQQLMIESLILASASGLGGFLLAFWSVPAILRTLPAEFPLPRMQEIAVDPWILLFTMTVSIGCGIFFSVVPALQASRTHISEGLRQGGRLASEGSRPLRNSLVVAEVAIAMLLVIGAGLMVRSFLLLNATNPGFRPQHLLTVRMILYPPFKSFGDLVNRRVAMVQQMLDRIRAMPQVTAASSIHLLPMTGMQSGTAYYRADRPAPPPGTPSGGEVSVISDDYFRTMAIPMVAGREFGLMDRNGGPRVAVINQAAAQFFYAGENPIGKHMIVAWGPPPNDVEIVGIATDIHHDGLAIKPDPCVFMPQSQRPSGYTSLLIRTGGDPRSIIPAVKEQIRAVLPTQGTAEVQTMEEVMSDSIAKPRLETTILGIFGVLALTLACVGIYAVISYSVSQRLREMGIRLALGAAPRGILRMVLSEGILLAVAGIGIGLMAAVALTRYLATLLYTVRPTDPAVFGVVSAVLAVAAAAGCYWPARRATRVDPAVVLREE